MRISVGKKCRHMYEIGAGQPPQRHDVFCSAIIAPTLHLKTRQIPYHYVTPISSFNVINACAHVLI